MLYISDNCRVVPAFCGTVWLDVISTLMCPLQQLVDWQHSKLATSQDMCMHDVHRINTSHQFPELASMPANRSEIGKAQRYAELGL
nr:hypothetical protein CFP56_21759 [Quercus suber]